MNHHPILFSTPLVKAITAGLKNQTRRIVKRPNQYGEVGDLLYVRETWAKNLTQTGPKYMYKADPDSHVYKDIKWKPSIHMPKEATRLWLQITGKRQERLQDITQEDAMMEGCEPYNWNHGGADVSQTGGTGYKYKVTYRDAFSYLWDSLNAKRGYPWSENPLVWVINFKIHTPKPS